ncbi:MAG: MOSC domain-containing protein [Bryobacteraceae bacterium]
MEQPAVAVFATIRELDEEPEEVAISLGRILSVNIGKARNVIVSGRSVRTGIFKAPVDGRVAIKRTKVEGDEVADLRVHGGPYKAVYLYPSEHYDFWKKELSLSELPFGSFGENLTTEGLREKAVHVGDQFQVGSSVLQVTQPRMPCFKLALRFERADMVKKFWQSERSGIYFSVVKEGEVERGNTIEKIESDPEQVSIAEVVGLYKGTEWSSDLLQRALRSPLFGSWKRDIQSRLTETE